MKAWPKDGKTADFGDIVQPLCKAVKFAYILKRQNRDKDIPWNGFDVGDSIKANSPNADVKLKSENLIYSENEQGRDALEEIISLAVQLGIEQGRRIAMNDGDYMLLKTQALVGKLWMDQKT